MSKIVLSDFDAATYLMLCSTLQTFKGKLGGNTVSLDYVDGKPVLAFDKDSLKEDLSTFLSMSQERYASLSCLEMPLADYYLLNDGGYENIKSLAEKVGMADNVEKWRDDLLYLKEEGTLEFRAYVRHGMPEESSYGHGYRFPDKVDINQLQAKLGVSEFRREVEKMGHGYYFTVTDALISSKAIKEGALRDTEFIYRPGASEKKFLEVFLDEKEDEYLCVSDQKPRGYRKVNSMEHERDLFSGMVSRAKGYCLEPNQHEEVLQEEKFFREMLMEHDPSLDPTGTVYTVFPEDIENGIVPPGCDIDVDSKGNRFLKTSYECRAVPEDGLVLVKKCDDANVYTICTRKQFDVLYKIGDYGLAKKSVRQEQNLKPGLRTRKGTKLY